MLDRDEAEQMQDQKPGAETFSRKHGIGQTEIYHIDIILENWKKIQKETTQKLNLRNCVIYCYDKLSGEIMNVDFSGSTFQPVSGEEIIGEATIKSCDFSGTLLQGLIEETDIKECGFQNAQLKNVRMNRTRIASCDFSNAYICKTSGDKENTLEETYIKDCDFKGTRFEDVRMEDVSLHWGNFLNAKMKNVEMEGVIFRDCFFRDTKMENTRMKGCKSKGFQSHCETIQISWKGPDWEFLERSKREIYRVLAPEKEKSMKLDMIQRMKEETAAEVHYASEISDMTELTLWEARAALQDGIRICCPEETPEPQGRHMGEYPIHEIWNPDELERIYHAKGKSASYKAYIYPGYEVWMNVSTEPGGTSWKKMREGYEKPEGVEKRLRMEEVKEYLSEKAEMIQSQEERIEIYLDREGEGSAGKEQGFYAYIGEKEYQGIFQIHNPDMEAGDMKMKACIYMENSDTREWYETGDWIDTREELDMTEGIDRIESKLQEHFRERYEIMVGKKEKVKAALESSEDYMDISKGFYTRRNPEGGQEMCYRMVHIGEGGILEPYPDEGEIFYDKETAREAMDIIYKNVIQEVEYDIIVQEAERIQKECRKEMKNEIADNIKESGFVPTAHMLQNIRKLNQMTGQKNTLKDIMNMHKKNGSDIQENVKKVVESVADECRGQEQAINIHQQRMEHRNVVQTPVK